MIHFSIRLRLQLNSTDPGQFSAVVSSILIFEMQRSKLQNLQVLVGL